MKFLIWFGCFFVYGLVTVTLSGYGVSLGGIPTILLIGVFFFLARTLCRKWDDHKWYEARRLEKEKEEQKAKAEQSLDRIVTVETEEKPETIHPTQTVFPATIAHKKPESQPQQEQGRRKYRKGWGWSVAALVCFIPMLFFDFLLSIDADYGFPFLLELICFVLLCVFLMRNKHNYPPIVTICVSVLCVILLLIAFVLNTSETWEYDDYGLSFFVIIFSIVPYINYILHIFKKDYQHGIPKQKIKHSCSIQAIIRDKEKAYEQIAKFYEYKEKGIMTEEEFEKSKAQILATIEE